MLHAHYSKRLRRVASSKSSPCLSPFLIPSNHFIFNQASLQEIKQQKKLYENDFTFLNNAINKEMQVRRQKLLSNNKNALKEILRKLFIDTNRTKKTYQRKLSMKDKDFYKYFQSKKKTMKKNFEDQNTKPKRHSRKNSSLKIVFPEKSKSKFVLIQKRAEHSSCLTPTTKSQFYS